MGVIHNGQSGAINKYDHRRRSRLYLFISKPRAPILYHRCPVGLQLHREPTNRVGQPCAWHHSQISPGISFARSGATCSVPAWSGLPSLHFEVISLSDALMPARFTVTRSCHSQSTQAAVMTATAALLRAPLWATKRLPSVAANASHIVVTTISYTSQL